MSSSTNWGALVAASLAVGCSAAPAPTPTPAPPAPAPPAPVASAPPAFQPQLSPPVDMLPDGKGGEDEHIGSISKRIIAYGRGHLVYESVERWGGTPPSCPLVRAEGCSFHTAFTTGKSPDERAWLDGVSPAPTDARPGKRLASPRDWVAFWGGREAVYGLARGGKIIDRIDDQGQVTRFAQDDAMADWHQIWLFEQGARVMAVGQTGEGSLVMGELIAGAASEPRKLGPTVALPMSPIPTQRPNAQGARAAAREGRLAMAGSPRFVPLPDEGDKKNLWAMVWVEAVPPPYDWPAGKPRGDGAKAKKGAKHGCGGPPSRPLSDRSVEKKAHVTRFSGASLLDDKVAWSNNNIDPFRPLLVRLDEGRLVVDPPKNDGPAPRVTYRFGRGSDADSYEQLHTRTNEVLVSAAFDAESKEGLVVARTGKKLFWRRFDADGAFVGEAVAYPHELQASYVELVRSGKNWLARMPNNTTTINLTEGAEPHRLKFDENFIALGLAPGQPRAQIVLLKGNGAKERKLFAAPLDDQGKLAGDPIHIADLTEGMDTDRSAIHTAGGAPFFAVLEQLEAKEENDKHTTRNRLAWAWLKPGSAWTALPDLPQAPPADNSYDSRQRVFFKRVDGDLVAWLPQGKNRLLAWVRAGQTAPLPGSADLSALSAELSHPGTSGHLLGKGELRLPAKPGAPLPSPELAEADSQCSFVMPTGPSTTVLACAHPVDPTEPAIRVGLRVHRTEPPPR